MRHLGQCVATPLQRAVGGTLALALVAFSFSAVPGAAQSPRQSLSDEPGFVDFEAFGDFDPDRIRLEINLGGALLRLLSSAVEEEDGEFAQLLRSLRSIQVSIYEGDSGQAESAQNRIRSVVRDLQRGGWESIVTVRDQGSLNLMVRSDDELILGLFAAFTDDQHSIGFLNIVGDFDPVQIGRLARQLDIDGLAGFDLEALEKEAAPEKKP